MLGIIPIKNFTQSIFDLVMPAKCLCCNSQVPQQGTICANCYTELKPIGNHKCYKCGLPFQIDMGHKAICHDCTRYKPSYSMARAFCNYEGLGGKLASQLKFSDKTLLAPYMAKMMMIAGSGLLKKSDIIAPIPLHHSRKLKRKYNQSALLAKYLAEYSGLEYQPFLLKRTRNTKKQTTLKRNDRKKNMENAFDASPHANEKRILLIDDVMTTGATMNAASVALKRQGAKKICALVFARVE